MLRGFQGMLSFELEATNSSSTNQAASFLNDELGSMEKSTSKKKESKLTNGTKSEYKPENIKVKFFGDQILPKPPKTIKDAMKALKLFPKVAKNSTSVIYYTMTPISRYCDSDLALVVRDINLDQTEELTKIPDELEETKLEVEALLERSVSQKYSRTIGKTLLDYLNELSKFQTSWMQNATIRILQFRGGKAKEKDIVNLMNAYRDSPFNPDAVHRFLQHRQRELETIESMIHEETEGIVIDEKDSGDGNNCLFQNKFAVQYILEILPTHNVTKVFMDHINKCTYPTNYTCLNKYDEKETKNWFWNDNLIAGAGTKLRGFLKLSHTSENKKDTCFMIKIEKQKSSKPSIKLYKNGKRIREDFCPPMKVEIPKNITTSMNQLNFTVKTSISDKVINILKVEYDEIIETDKKFDTKTNEENPIQFNKDVRYFDISNGTNDNFITLNGLSSNATYRIKVSVGSEFGYGPHSDEIKVITNAFSPPRNFKVTDRTHNSINLAWKKPKYPKSTNVNVTKYQIIIYASSNHTKYNFPMVIFVDGDQTSQLIEKLPTTEKFYITIEAQKENKTGSSYPFTVRKDSVAFLDTSTLPTKPKPPIIEDTNQDAIFISFRTPTKLKLRESKTEYFLKFARKINDTRMTETTRHTTREYFVLKELEQDAVYELHVKLNTSFGESLYSESALAHTVKTTSSYHSMLRDSLGIPNLERSIEGNHICLLDILYTVIYTIFLIT